MSECLCSQVDKNFDSGGLENILHGAEGQTAERRGDKADLFRPEEEEEEEKGEQQA